ncbi:hypothetical protein ACH5RR_011683 [Cinchona calisaya]|uniref:non-specific serine/threonine protein kinase n=1 Tax=Cinchona calisaya TaxID=153742 RepID=A0ABD3A978_9GENT
MHPDQLFLILVSILILSPASVNAYDEQFETCYQPFSCFNLGSLGYPFWGGNRPQYCGHPGFELDCNQYVYDFPRIQILSITYKILKIDTTSHILTIAREDLANNTCPEKLLNTTIDLNLFNPVSTDGSLLYLFYGCALNLNSISTQRISNSSFVCRGEKRANTTNFFTTKQASNDYLFTVCKTFITVPVDNITTWASVVDLRRALAAGFSLTWMENNTICDLCSKSGGRCGSIPDSTTFACYCPDRPHQLTCNDDQPAGRAN